MRSLVASLVIVAALALGTVNAQSTEYYGVSLSLGALGLPLPLLGVHAGFDDLIAEDVALRLNLSGFAFGSSGEFLVAGIAGADVLWSFPTEGDGAIRPYAGGGPGVVFAGVSGLGLELAPYLGVVAGVSLPLDGFGLRLEGRGNAAFGFLGESPWWLSVAIGVDFTP